MSDVPSLSTSERWDGECPGDHQFSTLENFSYDPNNRNHDFFQRVSQKLINEWDGDQFAGVLIHGEPGTGKSHAAIGLARALHDKGAEVSYRFVPELQPHTNTVSIWTAPRLLEPVYARGGATTTTTTKEVEEGSETTTSRTFVEANDMKVTQRDPQSVFPSFFDEGVERNPKTVLILDDYKPLWRPHMRSAIEAASNFGGLIIMTSNFGNIFHLQNPGESDLTPVAINPYNDSEEVKVAKAKAINYEIEKLKMSFMSRLVAGFVEIEFTGVDHRKQGSFWTDLYEPDDFK